jgi:hypothetical protein
MGSRAATQMMPGGDPFQQRGLRAQRQREQRCHSSEEYQWLRQFAALAYREADIPPQHRAERLPQSHALRRGVGQVEWVVGRDQDHAAGRGVVGGHCRFHRRECPAGGEIFARSEIVLHARDLAHVGQRGEELIQHFVPGGSAPGKAPPLDRRKAADCPQQGCLAAAVGAFELNDSARRSVLRLVADEPRIAGVVEVEFPHLLLVERP